ncbi:MAG: amino acid--tRNA ligase-related protein, partial [Gemmatimonadales bacterium]
MSGTVERPQVEQARREKLEALKALGVAPFAYRFDRTHTAAQAHALFKDGAEGPSVAVAGRLVSLRDHGKSYFAHLEDASGKIQLYLKKDVIGEEAFELVRLLDLGDHVGVRGTIMKTRTGEITVQAREIQLLTKALRPLPLGKVTVKEDGTEERHSDFADPELRYRQRYADLAVHAARRDVFHRRAAVVRAIRTHLDGLGFLEVETPVLQPLYGGAFARPFVTHYQALDHDFYLRIADELYLKR